MLFALLGNRCREPDRGDRRSVVSSARFEWRYISIDVDAVDLAAVLTGLDMLVEQAAESVLAWTGHEADTSSLGVGRHVAEVESEPSTARNRKSQRNRCP